MTGPEQPRTDHRLALHYRRLLLAYPSDYRRERGEELLDTLLATAPPGRRRPAVREAANLLRHGLRCRLGRPTSGGIVIVAGFTALLFGFLGSVAGSWLGWQAARPLPDSAEAAAIARTALPTRLPVHQMRRDELFFYDDPTDAWTIVSGGDDYTPGRVEFGFESDQDARTLASDVRGRLDASGWEVSDVEFHGERAFGEGATLYARRDGLTVWYSDLGAGATPRLDLTIVRARPTTPLPLAVLGGLVGALVGWLLAGWVSRRTAGRHRFVQVLVGLQVGLVFVGMFPAFLISTLVVVVSALEDPGWMPAPPWLGFAYLGRLPALLALLPALGVLGLALLPRRESKPAGLATG
ncbi:hypothetical protein BDK92_6581 [Micromonospora pisi]|uniref:Uncharacterized protein n=1 Tax=Micromonospora pisi TaxID=589240 RepID=A0A495JT24_9ACTN|nr:hypothetical protein [Micromonospora pisi]RKR92147.1 hypothetical protein BDK92_6581 [Micromonospora pisi]